jgi:hypothetical protein
MVVVFGRIRVSVGFCLPAWSAWVFVDVETQAAAVDCDSRVDYGHYSVLVKVMVREWVFPQRGSFFIPYVLQIASSTHTSYQHTDHPTQKTTTVSQTDPRSIVHPRVTFDYTNYKRSGM